MRKITREEADRWTELAREQGFTGESGIAVGRFVTEGIEDGVLTIRFVTPVPAGLYSEDLRRKAQPIMFDRLPSGELILPGRWWQLMFERLSEREDMPPDVRRTAAFVARMVTASVGLLPADTDTIEFEVPDEDGHLVLHEALPPGTVVGLRLEGLRDE